MSHYETLGLPVDASSGAIKTAYLERARKFHPDISKEKDADVFFAKIQEAHGVLKDPVKRKAYDIANGLRTEAGLLSDGKRDGPSASVLRHIEEFAPENIQGSYKRQMDKLRNQIGVDPIVLRNRCLLASVVGGAVLGGVYWWRSKQAPPVLPVDLGISLDSIDSGEHVRRKR